MRKYKLIKSPSKIYSSKRIRTNSPSQKPEPGTEYQEETADAVFEYIKISDRIDYNLRFLNEVFRDCCDFVPRTFTMEFHNKKCLAVFISGIIDMNIINQDVIKPVMDFGSSDCEDEKDWDGEILELIKNTQLNVSVFEKVSYVKDAVKQILEGCCLLFIEGSGSAAAINVSDFKTRSVGEAKVESVLRGPLEAFVEDVNINLTMIRRRLKTTDLKLEQYEMGKHSKTKVILSYLRGIADGQIIEEARKRLKKVNIDLLLDGGQIQNYIEDDPLSPFPQMDTTERPDVCAAALVEGRFAIFVDGSPFVIIAPTTFPYLFSAAEDYYNKYYFTSFIRFISYLAFLVTLSGPSIYIAVTTYHPEMFPATLLISVQGARANVPFPAFLEAVLIELMFEAIREVAVRLPSRISQALSIIGALVIGEISVQAGLVSPLMMIIVAVTGLASFIIPKLNSARQISVLRFPMMLFAATMGIFGLIMAGLVILIHLVSLRSFGVPYLSPITPLNPEGLKDTVIILPPWMMKKKYSYMNSDAGESSSNEAQYKNQNK